MSDPYVTLNVPRDASPERIRKAYRALARKHHPDRGGDAETFRAVTAAYELLSDPERRARYDATGDASAPNANPNAPLFGVLAPALQAVLMVLAARGQKVDRTNVLDMLRDGLRGELAERRKIRAQLDKLLASYKDVAGRFTEPDGLLAGLAKEHARRTETQLEAVREEEKRIADAIEYLSKCSYSHDGSPLHDALFSGFAQLKWGAAE